MTASKMYINGSYFLSIQPNFEENFRFESDEIVSYQHRPISIVEPNFKELIPALQLRRMNKSMRMSLYCGQKALNRSGQEKIDAILVGSGLGCLKDSEKFVATILEDEKQILNPTPFIQSTHNMAAATLAIALNCKGYNMTYVSAAHSFESALLDAKLYLSEHTDQQIMVGGVDEIGEKTPQFWEVTHMCNTENPHIPTLPNSSQGEIDSEGAAFFLVSAQKTEKTRLQIEGISFRNEIDLHAPHLYVLDFLHDHQLEPEDIDLLVMGYNGDLSSDSLYDLVIDSLFKESDQDIVGYKHIFGEFDTVSALGLALVCQIVEQGQIPAGPLIKPGTRSHNKKINRILMYQHRGTDAASIILLKNEYSL